MLNSYEEYSNSSEETIPVIVNDDDTPIMIPINILVTALDRGWICNEGIGEQDE